MSIARIIKHIPTGLSSIIVIALISYASLNEDPLNISQVKLFTGADKVIHFIMYFVLSTVLILDYAKLKMPHHTKLGIETALTTFAFAIGLIFEVIQGTLTESRTFDIYDVLANTLGAIAGFALLKFWAMHQFRKMMVPLYSHHRHHHHHKH